MIIKKLNSIFHRHSRWLFGLITIVIIISFIGFMVPGSFFGFGPDSGSGTVVGTAYGKRVTYDDLREVHRNLEVCNQIGFPVGETRIEQQFFFYCMTLKAAELGIAASDKEIAESLKKHPMLQSNGKFDMKKYTNLVTNLGKYGISKEDIEKAIRMILVISKLQNYVGGGTIATPGEARDLYRQYNTSYEARVAEYVLPKVTIDKPNAKKLADLPAASQRSTVAYFNANKGKYVIPGWQDVMVVEIKNNFFAPQAAKKASDKELLKFYNANKQLFAGKDGKTPAFQAAKAKVRTEFIKIESADMAQRAAEDLAVAAADAVSAADKSADKIKAFRACADKLKLAVQEVSKVPFDASKVGRINSPELVRAFNEYAGNPVTKAVVTADGACVGFLRNRVAARPAKLDEVLARVRTDEARDALLKNTRARMDKDYAALRKLPAARQGKAFDALKGVKFNTIKFTLSEPVMDGKYQQAMMTAIGLKAGAISAPMTNLQIVRLISRKAPDYKNFAGKESQYQMIVQMRKSQQMQAAFMEELGANCKLDPALSAER